MKHLIEASNFQGLFIEKLHWNYPNPGDDSITESFTDQNGQPQSFKFKYVAVRDGFKVLSCAVDKIPTLTTCRKIDRLLFRNAHDYIAIYHIPNTSHHAWVVPVKRVEKRDLVFVEYASADQADFLIQKLSSIRFGIGDMTTIADVRAKVQAAFLVNSESVTKSFYAGFRKQHDAFSEFIQNLPDEKDRKWYTSVMLNRLMFCYFIQKKGFLANNRNYLREKLDEIKQDQGNGQYYSFYRAFLRKLFSDGLNKPEKNRDNNFENVFGQIPYLNGGMFAEHQIEHDNPELDIKDEAFEKLFEFFDTYQWHLDTRITASGKDINPDVLGYIFEQYINVRAAMGAYYTKEDITEYIGKNCIVPFILDKLSRSTSEVCRGFEASGYVWQKMKGSGDAYIYDAVKKGYTSDWKTRIPKEIADGLDATQPKLLERRAKWNDKTPEEFALPTEIWRETIARLQRCDDLMQKIAAGEICHANDLITYNLDMRQFAYDLIDQSASSGFVFEFFEALKKVTILDPTCGSGAFLFAALNILEPLYEICIERMQDFAKEKSSKDHYLPLIQKELAAISDKYRSNIQYYIYKTIILNNLYGVDIMHEAVEIAKLRLFLKLVAVVDVDVNADNLGLDPLPDVDFNIRCGNTLVGYATEAELLKSLKCTDGTFYRLEASKKLQKVIEDCLKKVANAYAKFKLVQSEHAEDMVALNKAKTALSEALEALNDKLNHYYHEATQPKNDYDCWLASHQPFHWIGEFYDIIKGNGGFDVIIGNPPYVVYNENNYLYKVGGEYVTYSCKNLYAYILERGIEISHMGTRNGYIVPISSISNNKFKPLVELYGCKQISWHSSYSNRPGKLFDNVEQRLTISIAVMTNEPGKYYSSDYQHWYQVERVNLFRMISYYPNLSWNKSLVLYKIGSSLQFDISKKVHGNRIKSSIKDGKERVYYHDGPTYFIRAMPFKPNSSPGMRESSHYRCITSNNRMLLFCLMNSSIFYWHYKNVSNCRDFSEREIIAFPISNFSYDLFELSRKLEKSYIDNKVIKSRNYASGTVYYEEYYPSKSKPIIDEIDKVLAKHYGFTEEELDFIINYDIKYRMGDELGDGEA